MITKISIENIKGFGSPAQDLNVQLYPGKPNILVAPNGFGKSTISRAFDCLSADGLSLEETDIHKGDKSLLPRLKVVLDGQDYVTDHTKNEVYAHFQCFCINSPLKPTSVTKRIGGVRNYTVNSLDIEEVVLLKNTPIVKSLSYSSSDYKNTFGTNGKLLPNINGDLCRITRFPNAEFDSFVGVKNDRKVQKITDHLNSINATVEAINAMVNDQTFIELTAMPEYQKIVEFISNTFGCTGLMDVFLRFWILKRLYYSDRKQFKQAVERNKFEAFMVHLNESFSALDTTWVGIQAVEENRNLIVRFPKAGNISYGQRDSLYLFASFERIKFEMDGSRPIILVVDELFDYLDMVNMTIIQYFFSEFIAICKRRVDIYPIIMTHLSPEYYHNYTFSKMNVQYLGDSSGISNTPTKALLKARGVDETTSTLYGDVSKYLLHYHTGTINREADFLALGLRKKWGSGYGFYEYLIEECNKYFAGQPFDYYAITTAVRVRVEKVVHDSLQTDEDKTVFLDTNGTKKKFAEAVNRGVEIPDVFSLLGIIYNDAEHLPQNNDADKTIIYRLSNPMIKHMIHELFNFSTPVTLDYLK